jgi:hypothetical protein
LGRVEPGGNGEHGLLLRKRHRLGKAPVLRQRPGRHAVHWQQSLVPLSIHVEPLLRAVAQVPLVVNPASRHTLAQAELFQQVLHIRCAVARHRQIMRTQRTGQTFQQARAAVATGAVFQLQQGHVLDAAQAQRTRGRQAGDTASRNDHLRAPGRCRRRPVTAAAQQVAALVSHASKAPFDHRRRVTAEQRKRGGGKRGAPGYQGCTLPHSRS